MSSFVIFDTEFTAWPGSWENNWSREGEAREIIQLAALKVNLNGSQMGDTASLNVLVKPILNPELSDYIQDLTGIKQDVLDNHGVDFPSCAELFYEFTENGSLPCFSWGPDVNILKENHRIHDCSWQKNEGLYIDLKTCVKRQGLNYSDCVSGDLAARVGKPLVGHKHNALYDVKSILVFLQTLVAQNRLNWRDLYQEL